MVIIKETKMQLNINNLKIQNQFMHKKTNENQNLLKLSNHQYGFDTVSFSGREKSVKSISFGMNFKPVKKLGVRAFLKDPKLLFFNKMTDANGNISYVAYLDESNENAAKLIKQVQQQRRQRKSRLQMLRSDNKFQVEYEGRKRIITKVDDGYIIDIEDNVLRKYLERQLNEFKQLFNDCMEILQNVSQSYKQDNLNKLNKKLKSIKRLKTEIPQRFIADDLKTLNKLINQQPMVHTRYFDFIDNSKINLLTPVAEDL